jgi:hypothetical protein
MNLAVARGSVVVETLCYEPEGRVFEIDKVRFFFPISLVLPASTDPGVHSASYRNEYQKYKHNPIGLRGIALSHFYFYFVMYVLAHTRMAVGRSNRTV